MTWRKSKIKVHMIIMWRIMITDEKWVCFQTEWGGWSLSLLRGLSSPPRSSVFYLTFRIFELVLVKVKEFIEVRPRIVLIFGCNVLYVFCYVLLCMFVCEFICFVFVLSLAQRTMNVWCNTNFFTTVKKSYLLFNSVLVILVFVQFCSI